MPLFVLLAALMLAAALAFVLPTLLRGHMPPPDAKKKLKALDDARAAGILSDAEYAAKRRALGSDLVDALAKSAAPRRSHAAAFVIALLLPASAILLYRYVGNPQALDPTALSAPDEHGQSMEQAIAGLAAKLQQDPNDVDGWTLLGRAYEATEHFTDARDAFKHAHDLAKDDPDITVAYAQALALTGPTRRIEGEPRALIEGVLKAAPDNNRALWLLGISEYQSAHYDAAIAAWKHLIAVAPQDSDIFATVQEQIASAEAARDGRAPPERTTVVPARDETPPTQTREIATIAGPQLHVEVALDAKLKDRLAPGDVLFVYAKAANGPPMPLAIQRMPASQLPVSVTLTDGMGMLPSMKLSQFPQVIVGARVSKSGNAIAQSGDLQTLTQPLPVSATTPIKLMIDQVVP
jgi:cytochrome c-type biogenesis protein CcmH